MKCKVVTYKNEKGEVYIKGTDLYDLLNGVIMKYGSRTDLNVNGVCLKIQEMIIDLMKGHEP